MRDIENRADIQQFVDRFYDKILRDEIIGFIFTDVAKLDLPKHLPTMYDFWETLLFSVNAYHGNAMKVHVDLHEKSSLLPVHFDRWREVFSATIDELFAGEKAEAAKAKAATVLQVMKHRVDALSGISQGKIL